MIKSNLYKDQHRVKYCSIVIQPKVESMDWTKISSEKVEEELMKSGFPVWPEIVNNLNKLSAESINKNGLKPVKNWAFGTETSVKTKIPHYQIYTEFPVLVKKSSIYQELNDLLDDRVHIVTKKVYNADFKKYCLKDSSNFGFDGKYYWNKKSSSEDIEFLQNDMLTLRPKLRKIKNNMLTGQKLLKRMIMSEPDDRTGIWIADVVGGTGKTALFQTIIGESQLEGCYLRVSEGIERLSAKLRKKISNRLENNLGYPKWIWVNFGRTVEEKVLKAFADFGEQMLDGMLDDNFANTAEKDFIALPYVNLVVTANTPPNLRQLTGDRLKLLTLFPVYKDLKTLELADSLLIPIFVEIQVRVQQATLMHMLQYKYKVRLQNKDYVEAHFSRFEYYEELLENIDKYLEFTKTRAYNDQYYQSKLETEWQAASPRDVPQDIFNVYVKACYAISQQGPWGTFSEASSLKRKNKSSAIDRNGTEF